MDSRRNTDSPTEDLRAELRADLPAEGSPSATDALLAAVKAGPPPAGAWLVEEIARRDRQTAEVLRAELQNRRAPWLHSAMAQRAEDVPAPAEPADAADAAGADAPEPEPLG